jgi:Glucodextranase, domain B
MQQGWVPAVISYMRARTRLAQLAVSAAALGVAGCGAGAAPTTPHVNLTISAPTSGATVGVHQVTVVGSVIPAGAHVSVNGQSAPVTGGVFKQQAWISAPNQKITVVGAAPGYAVTSTSTTVSYSSGVAAQLVAATAALKTMPASVPSSPRGHHSSATSIKAINAVFNLNPSGSPATGGGSSSTGGSGANHPTTPAPTPPTNPSGGSTGSGSTPSTGTTKPSSTPTTPPPPTPAQIAAAIRKAWVHGCIPRHKGQNVVPYCTCTYVQLAHSGMLSTKQSLNHLLKELKPYERTGNPTKLPRFVRHAVNACISKFPPVDPLTGKPKLKTFSGINHPGQAGSSAPLSPVPGTLGSPAPTPGSPAPTSGSQPTSTGPALAPQP